jgi:hypothetical protein
MWRYVYDHFLNDYDYFYVSGDDVYLMVDNFRAYLQELYDHDTATSTTTPPRHFGSWLPKRDMIAGGPGYTLNRVALQTWVESSSEYGWSRCFANRRASSEDWLISRCMSGLGIHGNATDTRDVATGEQRFHDACPIALYLFRADHESRAYFRRQAAAWEDQPMPNWTSGGSSSINTSNTTMMVGPKHGLDAAAKYSISFHRIRYPFYTARIHAILQASNEIRNHQHLTVCPSDSPLGRGLLEHYRNITLEIKGWH